MYILCINRQPPSLHFLETLRKVFFVNGLLAALQGRLMLCPEFLFYTMDLRRPLTNWHEIRTRLVWGQSLYLLLKKIPYL